MKLYKSLKRLVFRFLFLVWSRTPLLVFVPHHLLVGHDMATKFCVRTGIVVQGSRRRKTNIIIFLPLCFTGISGPYGPPILTLAEGWLASLPSILCPPQQGAEA